MQLQDLYRELGQEVKAWMEHEYEVHGPVPFDYVENFEAWTKRYPKKRAMRTLSGLLIGILIGMLTAPAFADCSPGHTPSYNDISAIQVRDGNPVAPVNFDIVIHADGHGSFINSGRGAPAGEFEHFKAPALFQTFRRMLAQRDFYSIRLHQSDTKYFDGPSGEISVMRCGVITELASRNDTFSFQVDPNNQGHNKLLQLVDALEVPLFAYPWHNEKRDPLPPN